MQGPSTKERTSARSKSTGKGAPSGGGRSAGPGPPRFEPVPKTRSAAANGRRTGAAPHATDQVSLTDFGAGANISLSKSSGHVNGHTSCVCVLHPQRICNTRHVFARRIKQTLFHLLHRAPIVSFDCIYNLSGL